MMTAPEVGRRRTVELLVAFRLLFHAMLTDEKWTKKTKQQNVVSICQHNCIENINMTVYYLEYNIVSKHSSVFNNQVPVRNGNLGTDRTTTTKAASVRKQLGTQNSKSNKGRQAKNGGVNGRDGSAEELDRETGEEQITVGWTRRKDGG